MLGSWTTQGTRYAEEEVHSRGNNQQTEIAEVIIASGSTVVEAARRIWVSEQTFSRWRAEYGGLGVDQA